ncbi:hypothetical protein [Tamlana sp. I1]|uniref:hypothetical protein n=1 Tax=Tamlana sp. I1 TaxID=2762061 RepID=UPI0018905E26|nr:hypothetical protein [Tamlana sp. I1]
MKQLKIATTLFLLLTFSGFAQSDKVIEKANEKVEEINTQIITGDRSQALSEAQRFEVKLLFINRSRELENAREAGTYEADNKAIIKKYSQKLFKEVLTKDQMKARKKGKELLSN